MWTDKSLQLHRVEFEVTVFYENWSVPAQPQSEGILQKLVN
jgi:hypothetical protein